METTVDLEKLKKALPMLEMEAFLKRVLGQLDILFAVLSDVYEEEEGTPARLIRALAENNSEALRMEAHRVKGMAANIAAESLRQTASALESAAKNNQGDLPALLSEMLKELFPLLEALKNLKHNIR